MADSNQDSEDGTVEILFLSQAYASVSVGVLLFVGIVFRVIQCRRPRRPQDGLLAVAELGKVRNCCSFMLVTTLALPAMIFIGCMLLGWLLGAVEGWGANDGFEYVLGNAVGVGPMVDLVPTNTGGMVVDVIISLWALLFGQTVLGVAAAFSIVSPLVGLVPRGVCGLVLGLLIVVPAVLAILAAVLGYVMARLEGWPFPDGFLFMIGAICGIEDPLTAVVPVTDNGYFFASLCYLAELLLGGTIIGIVQAHHIITESIVALEGVQAEPEETGPSLGRIAAEAEPEEAEPPKEAAESNDGNWGMVTPGPGEESREVLFAQLRAEREEVARLRSMIKASEETSIITAQ